MMLLLVMMMIMWITLACLGNVRGCCSEEMKKKGECFLHHIRLLAGLLKTWRQCHWRFDAVVVVGYEPRRETPPRSWVCDGDGFGASSFVYRLRC